MRAAGTHPTPLLRLPENHKPDSRTRRPVQGYLKFYSGLNLNQYSVGSPCRTICTVCGSLPCPDLNLIHYIPKPRACVPHTPYTPQKSRLPEIHFSGSLLIRQGVGWVDKPNIPNFMCWVTPAANPTYSLLTEIHFSGSLLRQVERATPVLAAFVNKGKTCR